MPSNAVAPAPSAEEWARGRWDIARWAWVYLGIRIHPGQRRMGQAYLRRTESRWRALYLWLLVSAGNRAGKTLMLSIIILHSCFYRMGLKPPEDPDNPWDLKHWAEQPYHWWHFAVEQGPAEQVFAEIISILGGSHAAQKYGCPWAQQMGEGDGVEGARRLATATATEGVEWTNGAKERGEYAQIILAKQFGGAIIHFRSTKAKALSAIGQNMHGLSFDEAGLEANLWYLLNEVMHARRLGTGGQFIVISTPSVATSTDFQDLWALGDPDDPFTDPRRHSMRMSSRDNVGYGLDRESFDALVDGQDENWIKQNIEGEFIQASAAWFSGPAVDACFRPNLPVEHNPEPGHVYIQALDPGLKDLTWSLVFEVLPGRRLVGVSIERMSGKQTTRGIVQLGVNQHRRYGIYLGEGPEGPLYDAFIETGVDTTALGGHMFRELLEESITIKSVEFGGQAKAKRQMLSDAKSAIDEGRVIMPAEGYWKEVRKQLRNYKLLDRKIEQDLVMGVAIAVKLLRAAPVPGESRSQPFEYGIIEGPEPSRDGINSASIRRKQTQRRQARRRGRLAT